jgi:hypothetical protein
VSGESAKEASGGHEASNDVVWVYRKSEDGGGYDVLRKRGSEVQAGTVRPLDQAKPIHGEVIRLKPREDSPALFDVEVELAGRASTGGPAKVATDRYRKGWESIWAKKPADTTLN